MVRCALSLFLISAIILISCKENESTLDHPELPRHSLNIDGDVQLQAEIHWIDSTQTLETNIRAENVSADTTVIETGSCAFQILAYSSAGSGKELIWHSQMHEHFVCFDELLVYQIPPDETLSFDRQQYINGNSWKRPIPKGEWEFEIHAKSENDEEIVIPANRLVIR
ncbi:hypothetical protein [Rhodohalobacter barkolensis]|uniref:Intracellular proteinase inhibitor BsuPI domain-containing protein n=1 Tax=Rhodohalobacter barkolensis TaxID=2053187 RepID=A0A2N0VDY1_9BACT|nr:hypothetical protein [Rhodohalobacter barkolensis]PKD42405.1 hypothetical protein CWD77_15300 [Rhodohalobacter barkolensis]